MPATKKSKSSKPRRQRRARKSTLPDRAYVVDDVVQDFQANPNVAYTIKNFALTNSQRAKSVAAAYQLYRIKKVEIFFKPTADTFIAQQTGGGSQVSIPYLYTLVDKGLTLPSAWSLSMIKSAGAKPRRLDDKTLVTSFAPACYLGSTDTPVSAPALVSELSAMLKTSPWLTTNANAGETNSVWAPSSVDHHGISFIIDQFNQAAGMISAQVTFRLHYEFKKPVWSTAAPGVHEAEMIDMDVLGNPVL